MQKKTRHGTIPKWRDVPLTDTQFDIAIANHRRSIAKWKGIAIASSVIAMCSMLSAGAVGVFGDGLANAAHPVASATRTAPSPASSASTAAETTSDGIETTIVTPDLDDVVATAFANLRSTDTAAAISAAGVTLSNAESAQLQHAISAYHEQGFEVSFAVVDMRTGAVIMSFANVPRYSASSIKAPYILSLAQTGAIDLDAVSTSVDADAAYLNQLITATLTVSDNDSYDSLYRRYGTSPFTAWTAGYTFDAPLSGYYEFLTASDLARLWVLGYQYLFSDMAPAKADGAEPASQQARAWFAQQMRGSLNSSIQMAHAESEEVYTKAGWIYGEGDLYALNDAGIVLPAGAHDLQMHPQGYVLAILSDACGRNDLLNKLATAVDDVIADLHGES